MALIADFMTETRIEVKGAYHKIIRAEVRSLGAAKPATFDDDGNVKTQAVPAATIKVRVGTYASEAAADDDAPLLANREFGPWEFDRASSSNTYAAAYAKLKTLPEFDGAVDG